MGFLDEAKGLAGKAKDLAEEHAEVGEVLDADRVAYANLVTNLIDVLIVQDRKQPSPQIGALLPQMQLGKSTHEGFLDEVVGGRHIVDQRTGIAPQSRDLSFEILIGICHEWRPSAGPAPKWRSRQYGR